jgi:hypothetical protein
MQGPHTARPSGASEALRALRLQKRKPIDEDRPPPSTLPGPKRKPLPDQMALGEEARRDDAA